MWIVRGVSGLTVVPTKSERSCLTLTHSLTHSLAHSLSLTHPLSLTHNKEKRKVHILSPTSHTYTNHNCLPYGFEKGKKKKKKKKKEKKSSQQRKTKSAQEKAHSFPHITHTHKTTISYRTGSKKGKTNKIKKTKKNKKTRENELTTKKNKNKKCRKKHIRFPTSHTHTKPQFPTVRVLKKERKKKKKKKKRRFAHFTSPALHTHDPPSETAITY